MKLKVRNTDFLAVNDDNNDALNRNEETATSGKNRSMNYDDNNDEDEREKRERGQRREAEVPLRLKVEQIETKVPDTERGEIRGPRRKKRGIKRTTRGLKGFEKPTNPDEGTIVEVWYKPLARTSLISSRPIAIKR